MATVLCYDKSSGRFFEVDETKYRQAIDRMNQELYRDGVLSTNRVYDLLNKVLPEDLPEDLELKPPLNGWGDKIGYAHMVGGIEFAFQSTALRGPHGEIVLTFDVAPLN